MDERTDKLIKKNKGLLRQLNCLNNEVKGLKWRVKKLEKKDSYYPMTEKEIRNIKVGGTD